MSQKPTYAELEKKIRDLTGTSKNVRSIIQASMDGFWLVDNEGNILEVNQAYSRMSGYTEEELLSMTIADLEEVETPGQTRKHIRRIMKNGQDRFESKHRCKDGTIVDVEVTAQYRETDGGRLVCFIRDITEETKAEKKLKHEKDRAQQYLDLAGTMILALDKKGNVALMNRTGCKILGYQESEILGRNWFDDFLITEDVDRLKIVFDRIVSGDEKLFEYVENYVLCKNGEKSLIAWHNSILQDENGNIIGTLSSGEDITDRRRDEENLRESEERFRQLAENIKEVFWIGSPDWNTVYYISPAYETVWGQSCESLYKNARSWMHAVHEEDRRTVLSQIPEELEGLNKFIFPEYRIVRPDGSIRWIFARAYPIRNESGEIYRIAGIAEDITDRKQFEDKLQELESQQRALIDAVPDALFLMKTDGEIVVANAGLSKRFGKTVQELTGTNSYDLVETDVAQKRKEITGQSIRSGKTTNYEDTRAGRIIESRIFPIKDDQKRVSHLAILGRDITERKQAEKEREKLLEQLNQAQKMESIGRLAGGIAHDFNNLLTAIHGFSDLIQSSLDTDDPMKKDVAEIQKAAESASQLTNQLLAFSRKQLIAPRAVNLNKAILHSENMLRRIVGEDIRFVFKPGDAIHKILIDPNQVDQILVNLSVNSRDAMPDGGILTIETKNVSFVRKACDACGEEMSGDYVMLSFSDTGYGIREEIRNKIFEPFFTTKNEGVGSGLGLSTVHGIVIQNEGHVTVSSKPGEGTSFRIYFPITEREEMEQSDEEDVSRTGGQETILLVEDMEIVRKLAAGILSKQGYRVVEASSGQEAVELFEANKKEIDLLVTDVVMPGMGGTELLEQLLNIRPELKALFMSGHPQDAIAQQGILDTGTNFIQKPFRPKEFSQKVREVLDS